MLYAKATGVLSLNTCMKQKAFYIVNYVLDSEQRSRLNVIKQKLQGKFKFLNDMDKDKNKYCEVDGTETEIKEPENIIANIKIL